MSHFSVIVTGENIERQLQPFHEFECTGKDDEFVKDVDVTEDAREEFEASTTTRYRSPNGELHDPYQDHFYRQPTAEETKKIGVIAGSGCGHGLSWSSQDWNDGRGYSTRIHFIPDGWEEIQVPTKDVETFAEWASGYYGKKIWPHFDTVPTKEERDFKYGYILLESTGEVKKIINRTNPDKKWDWWQVGGRYSSRLILNDGKTADSAIKGDINYAIMRASKVHEATKTWNEAMAVFGDLPVHKSWAEMGGDRDAYWEQPRLKALSEERKKTNSLFWLSADDFLVSREQYLKQAEDSAYGAFAFLHNGQWVEKGSMGLWGAVHGEKTDGEWYSWMAEQIKSLPDDTRITIVDCHI